MCTKGKKRASSVILDLFVINSPVYCKTFFDTRNTFEVFVNTNIRGKQMYFGKAAGAEKNFPLGFYRDWLGCPLGNERALLYL